MKVAVTGAAGRLGQVVVRALHAKGHQVVATDRDSTNQLPVRVEQLDLCDTEGCYRLLEGCDALVHLGNIPFITPVRPQHGFINNATVNANVFQAALDSGVEKIIYASSVQTCSGEWHQPAKEGLISPGPLPYLPLDGRLPANPGNLYSASKMVGEGLLAYYAKFYGLSTVAIRFPFLIDSGKAGADLERIRREAVVNEGFAYLSLPDAAELVAAVLKAELPGFRIYLPASPDTILSPLTIEEIVARYYPDVPIRTPGKLESLVDISEITRDTGWVPRCRLAGS
jgi:nucleoside-diphosphate-sugar epimerase